MGTDLYHCYHCYWYHCYTQQVDNIGLSLLYPQYPQVGEISPPGPSRLRGFIVKVLQQFGRRHPPRPYPPWIGQGGTMLCYTSLDLFGDCYHLVMTNIAMESIGTWPFIVDIPIRYGDFQ